jgi:hypothetical protein
MLQVFFHKNKPFGKSLKAGINRRQGSVNKQPFRVNGSFLPVYVFTVKRA